MEIISGNIFDSNCRFLVNTINTVGAMGSGLALEFRLRIPIMYERYKDKCRNKELKIGQYWIFDDDQRLHKKILNFPTKSTFTKPSKPEYLYKGLYYFKENYGKNGIESIAFPVLGSRNGKLDRNYSMNIMRSFLDDIPINIEICLNQVQDKFTIKVIEFIESMNEKEIRDEVGLTKHYSRKLKENIHRIIFLSELVTFKILPVIEAGKLYDFSFRKIYKKKILEYTSVM